MTEEELNLLAMNIEKYIPEDMGFFLLVAPTGDAPQTKRSQYVSNCDRESAISVMKEWLIQCGHEEDWMKHIS